MMTLLILSFLAGVLTILAPCVLPMLPIMLGGAAGSENKKSVWIIPVSLGVSVFVFTLLLKATTLLINIPNSFWSWFSAGILIFLGITFAFPAFWESMSVKMGLGAKTQKLLQKSSHGKQGITRDIFMGAALGPVFSSCSPTYFFIIATVLPQSLAAGLVYLTAYTVGLVLMLFAIALLGRKLINKLHWATDSHGWFKRGLGFLFIFLGFAIGFGFDKQFEVLLLDTGIYDFLDFEYELLEQMDS